MTDMKIDPERVTLNAGGICWRDWFVRLPQGMVADDVKNPKLWARVQQRRDKALARHDKLYLVAHDESFSVEARVKDANSASAVLSILKIISIGERMTPLFSDENYRVVWDGTGFGIERRADGVRVGGLHGSEALAIQALRRQYPVNVE